MVSILESRGVFIYLIILFVDVRKYAHTYCESPPRVLLYKLCRIYNHGCRHGFEELQKLKHRSKSTLCTCTDIERARIRCMLCLDRYRVYGHIRVRSLPQVLEHADDGDRVLA